MARETELTCPSGLRVRLRSIKGKDLDGLRDKRKVATGEAISTLLNECTLEVLDAAIYKDLPTAFSWADTLIGDRMKAIVALRQATSGEEYDFRLRCRDPECREMIDWTINLSDLPEKRLTPENAAVFLSGNVFETLINDTLVKFKLRTGRDQAKLQKQILQMDAAARDHDKKNRQSAENRAVIGVFARIISVDGVTNVMDWLGELDLSEINQLSKAMDAADCGIETTIQVVCENVNGNGCGLKQEVELPLDSTFFQQR
jgi:hypothetical protein